MGILLNIILAISVTLDSFIVGKSVDKKIAFTLISISLAHVLLFLIGVKIGDEIGPLISKYDHWVSFTVFLFLSLSCYKDLFSEEPVFKLDNVFKILITTQPKNHGYTINHSKHFFCLEKCLANLR